MAFRDIQMRCRELLVLVLDLFRLLIDPGLMNISFSCHLGSAFWDFQSNEDFLWQFKDQKRNFIPKMHYAILHLLLFVFYCKFRTTQRDGLLHPVIVLMDGVSLSL